MTRLKVKASKSTVVSELRAALTDACTHCPDCAGDGLVGLPGAWMACATCAWWRRTLNFTYDAPWHERLSEKVLQLRLGLSQLW